MNNTRLILVRHGQTNGNVQRLLQGRTDEPLSEFGQQQAATMAQRVAEEFKIDRLLCSPLLRAQQTAAHLTALTELEARIEDGLQEIDFGDFEGAAADDISQSHPEFFARWQDVELEDFYWPNGESRMGFHQRAVSTLQQIAVTHQQLTVAVVSHGGLLGSYLAQVRGISPNDWQATALHNCSVSVVTLSSEEIEVESFNDIGHLADLSVAEGV
jgi:2,3-bisphosphoglycerate-dependent phosphoglycerate mutase